MTEREKMLHFYLSNHDFELYVNNNCRTYHRTRDEELQSPITIEYYRSMQRGGCNAPRDKQ